jgi:hypothetical protein
MPQYAVYSCPTVTLGQAAALRHRTRLSTHQAVKQLPDLHVLGDV